MFLIKWRSKDGYFAVCRHRQTVTGCSRYASRELAEKQVERFRRLFRFNDYFIEPV